MEIAPALAGAWAIHSTTTASAPLAASLIASAIAFASISEPLLSPDASGPDDKGNNHDQRHFKHDSLPTLAV